MDGTTDWRPVQGCNPPYGVDPSATAPATAAGADWRAQLKHDDRTRMVDSILETLKVHLPVLNQHELNELRSIAVRFEERTYTTATSQSGYLGKISWKMRQLEMRLQVLGNAQVYPNQNSPGQGLQF